MIDSRKCFICNNPIGDGIKSCECMDKVFDNIDIYYALNGEKRGPIKKTELYSLLEKQIINGSTLIWTDHFDDWIQLNESLFNQYLKRHPPPLMRDSVNNDVVWFLAFAPIIGLFVEILIAGLMGIGFHALWFITIILNIYLCSLDERNLKKAGHNTDSLGSVFLVPVYLFKRAEMLEQGNEYAVNWCITFAIMFIISLLIA